jgi:hypothetical protein
MLDVEVHGHPRCAVPFARVAHGVDESILAQGQPGQPVVAAFPFGQFGRQGFLFQSRHAADPAVERRRTEVVGLQAAAGGEQGIGVGIEPAAEGGGGGIRANGKRRHGMGHTREPILFAW